MHKVIETYTHLNGRIGAMVEVSCETDFAAKTDVFATFVHGVVLQVAAMNPEHRVALLAQPSILHSEKTVGTLLREVSEELKERCDVVRLVRWAVE